MQSVDKRDLNTPDSWIPRDPRLIRLTGIHPFNAEPPLSSILETPTPSNLHYVRNHGSVPKLDWDTHKISVGGLVVHPRDYSMQELSEKPAIRLRTSHISIKMCCFVAFSSIFCSYRTKHPDFQNELFIDSVYLSESRYNSLLD